MAVKSSKRYGIILPKNINFITHIDFCKLYGIPVNDFIKLVSNSKELAKTKANYTHFSKSVINGKTFDLSATDNNQVHNLLLGSYRRDSDRKVVPIWLLSEEYAKNLAIYFGKIKETKEENKASKKERQQENNIKDDESSIVKIFINGELVDIINLDENEEDYDNDGEDSEDEEYLNTKIELLKELNDDYTKIVEDNIKELAKNTILRRLIINKINKMKSNS